MISERDAQQAELLEEYCQALVADSASLPPAGLEPELARTSRRLRQQLRAPLPSVHFAAALQAQLEQESAMTFASEAEVLPPVKPAPRPLRVARVTVGWLAAAALIVLSVASALYVASDLASRAQRQSLPVQPEAHSAAEIIARAKAMYQSDAIKSFELTEVFTTTGDNKLWKTNHIFYQAPGRSREENSDSTIKIDDGATVWNYAPPGSADYGGDVSFSSHDFALIQMNGTILTYIASLNSTIYQLSNCYQPTLIGEDVVAGRPTYVLDTGVEISRCNSANGNPYDNIRLWLDHDSYFILKIAPEKNSSLQQVVSEVASVQYNLPLATDLFTFVMPKGVNFRGGWVTISQGAGNFGGQYITPVSRQYITPISNDEFRAKAAKLVGVISFTTYLPAYLPKQMQINYFSYRAWTGEMDITYVTSSTYSYPPVPDRLGYFDTNPPALVQLTMRQATKEVISDTTKGLQHIVINGESGWVSADGEQSNCNTPGSASACVLQRLEVVIVRGGTIITAYGERISLDDVTKIAASLTPLQPSPPAGPAFPTMPVPPTAPPLPTEPDGSMP